MSFGGVRRALKRVVPGTVWTRLRSVRYAIGRTDGMPPDERVARIAALADPIRSRSPGWQKYFYALEQVGLHVWPVHFHSPAPDTRELAVNRHRWAKESDFSCVRYDRAAEARLNNELARSQPEYAGMLAAESLKAAGLGPGYGRSRRCCCTRFSGTSSHGG